MYYNIYYAQYIYIFTLSSHGIYNLNGLLIAYAVNVDQYIYLIIPLIYLTGKIKDSTTKKPKIEKNIDFNSIQEMQFLGENVIFCKGHSCNGKCGWITSSCSCDKTCIIYNSCCYDFGKVCNITRANATSGHHDTSSLDAYVPSMRKEYLYSTCESIMDTDKKALMIYSQVTRCPNDTDIETKSLCEDKPSGHDLSRFVTVSTNESLYRNIYCARCHGINREDVIFWKPDFKCETSIPNISSMKENIKYLLKFCVLTLTPPDTGISTYAAECQHLGVDTCPRVRKDGTVNTDSIISACTRYSAPVMKPSFKNPHCGICNGYTKDSFECSFMKDLATPEDERFEFPSFSLLMDFTGSSGISINSKFGDAMSITICNPDETDIDGECIKPNITTSCLQQMRNESVGDFYIGLNVTFLGIQNLENITKAIVNSIKSKLPGSQVLDNPMSSICSIQNMTNLLDCSIVYRFTMSKPFLVETIEELLTYFEYDFTMKYALDINLYLINNIFQGQGGCKFGVVNSYSMEEFDTVRKESEEYIIIKSTQTMYRMNEINVFVNLIPSKEDHYGGKRGYWVSVCETELRNCSKIFLEPDEYTMASGGNIVLRRSEYIISRYEMCGEKAVVCADWLTPVSRPQNGNPGIQGELTLVGNCISEAFLAYTLVVHAALPSLRTVPGRCVMALSLSLFLAQLMFQLSSLASSVFPVCVMMACLQHYFWLTSFCWMSVLAFDLSATFSGGGKMTDARQKEKKFRYFNIYAWCVPATVVITSLVLQFANGMLIYANDNFCWINGSQNLLIFFVAPLAVTLCCNLVFFVRCVVGIFRTKTITQKARRGSKLDLFIYVKLSSLMGFTWISGFLANAVQIEGFWYVFIVCNTLQGVAIGVTFAMSPRVLKMIWTKCGGKSVSSQNESTFTNISSSKTK